MIGSQKIEEMLRYKFRGKKQKDNSWIYGLIIKDTYGHYRIQFDANQFSQVVKPETVGQLWATKDNTKFYEGDIISFGISGRLICVLIYNEINKCFSFIEKSEYNKLQTADELLRLNILSNLSYAKVEMIKALLGNIHDNPELLNN